MYDMNKSKYQQFNYTLVVIIASIIVQGSFVELVIKLIIWLAIITWLISNHKIS